mgnify:CR=1 FL=1
MILLYSRDILLIDLHINMTVGVVSIDKSASPLLQVCKPLLHSNARATTLK